MHVQGKCYTEIPVVVENGQKVVFVCSAGIKVAHTIRFFVVVGGALPNPFNPATILSIGFGHGANFSARVGAGKWLPPNET
jgi:hypothetical protein